MRHTTDAREIKGYLKDRLILEQELSKALLDEFGKGAFYNDLRDALTAAMGFLAGLEGAEKAALTHVEGENQFLAGLNKNGRTAKKVHQLLVNNARVSLPHMADLIRFFGEVVDELSKPEYKATFGDSYSRWLAMRSEQIGWRYGGGGERFRSLLDPNYRAKANRGSVWQKTTTTEFPSGGRIRVRNPIPPKIRYADPFPGRVLPTQFVRLEHLGVAGGHAGSSVWALKDESTMRKVDLVFGLPEGADISGTTTDCMHFLKAVPHLAEDGMDSAPGPLIQMLPLATIVSEYHHSLLEVALAMSLRKVINYQIGFYTSLLPDSPGPGKVHSSRRAVRSVLERFEADRRNRHMLIYYKNNSDRIDGAFIAEPKEYSQFKQLGTCDIRIWPKFNAMDHFPSERNVMSLLADAGLQNAALQSRRGSLRQTGHSLW